MEEPMSCWCATEWGKPIWGQDLYGGGLRRRMAGGVLQTDLWSSASSWQSPKPPCFPCCLGMILLVKCPVTWLQANQVFLFFITSSLSSYIIRSFIASCSFFIISLVYKSIMFLCRKTQKHYDSASKEKKCVRAVGGWMHFFFFFSDCAKLPSTGSAF